MGFATIYVDGIGDAAPAEGARSRLLREYERVQRQIGALGSDIKRLRAEVGESSPAYAAVVRKARDLSAQGRVVRMRIVNDEPSASGLLRQFAATAAALAQEVVTQLDRLGKAAAAGTVAIAQGAADVGKGLGAGIGGGLKWLGLGAAALGAVWLLGPRLLRKSNPRRRRRVRRR